MDEKQLLELKSRVDKTKTTISELTGQQTALLKQLKDDYECETVEKAKEKLRVIDKNITILDRKITKGVEELEEKYNVE